MHLNSNAVLYPEPSIEVDDDDSLWPHNPALKKGSHILELADGSEDDDYDDMPGLAPVDDDSDSDSDSEDDSSDEEAPAESAEAELSKFQINACQKLS